MGSEAELEQTSILKLPLMWSTQARPMMESPNHPSGMVTPPLQTSASVPFQWEEEPGKPRPCTTLVLSSNNPNNNNNNNGHGGTTKCLDLPPRLFMDSKITKMPSPTTVLDGPYLGKSIFQSSSFRITRDHSQGYFGNFNSLSPERGQLGDMVLSSKRGGGGGGGEHKERGMFGSWGGQRTFKIKDSTGKKEIGEGSFVFSSSMDIEVGCGGVDSNSAYNSSTKVKIRRIRRNGSFSSRSQPKSHFWAAIYKGFKQVIPWSKESKEKGPIL